MLVRPLVVPLLLVVTPDAVRELRWPGGNGFMGGRWLFLSSLLVLVAAAAALDLAALLLLLLLLPAVAGLDVLLLAAELSAALCSTPPLPLVSWAGGEAEEEE